MNQIAYYLTDKTSCCNPSSILMNNFVLLLVLILISGTRHVSAFMTTKTRCCCLKLEFHMIGHLFATTNIKDDPKWTHADIEWRLSPDPNIPTLEKLKIKAAAKAIRLELLLKNEPVPPILCPKGGKAELEAYREGKKVAKFGITTKRGPSSPEIDETIFDYYGEMPSPGIGAIIYMYVEPQFRRHGIGELALEVIYAIQTIQNIDFIILVANDNGSGKLLKWYERNGFLQAPKLQDCFGSPGGKFGTTMIRPTEVASDIFSRCKIKWW